MPIEVRFGIGVPDPFRAPGIADIIRDQQRRRAQRVGRSGGVTQADRARARTRARVPRVASRRISARVIGATAANPLFGIGAAIIITAKDVADAITRKQQRDIDDELEALNEQVTREVQRRNREKQLRATSVRRGPPGRDIPGELSKGRENSSVLSLPPSQLGRIEIGTPVEIDRGQLPAPGPIIPERPGTPNIPAPTPSPGPGRSPITLPTPAPGPAPAPKPASRPIPGIGSPSPVFTPRTSPRTAPKPFPIGFPFQSPFNFPKNSPRRGPRPQKFRRPGSLTGSDPRLVQFAQPSPNPQTNPDKRCKPCPKKKKPKRRSKCFKGLYREGRMDNDVSYEEWVEIDCESGRELGKNRGTCRNDKGEFESCP